MNAVQLTTEFAVIQERMAGMQKEIDALKVAQQKADDARLRAEAEHAAEVAALRTENAVQKARLDELTKRLDVWSGRAWGLVTVFVGTVLSLTSALVLALARK